MLLFHQNIHSSLVAKSHIHVALVSQLVYMLAELTMVTRAHMNAAPGYSGYFGLKHGVCSTISKQIRLLDPPDIQLAPHEQYGVMLGLFPVVVVFFFFI